MIRAVFFDLEGVLVDYGRFQEKVVEKALAHAGVKPCFRVRDVYAIRSLPEFHKKQDFFKALIALNKLGIKKAGSGARLQATRVKLRKAVNNLSKAELVESEVAVREYSRIRRNPGRLLNLAKKIQGSASLLKQLRNKGFKTVIITNANKLFASSLIKKFGFKVDLLVTEDAGLKEKRLKEKPSPSMINYALKKLGVFPQEVVLVEDSLAGIIAGKRAGVKTIGVLTGNSKREELAKQADFILENAKQVLKEVLRR